MSIGEFMIGLFEKTNKIFAEDFNIKNVDSLNKALDNIPNRGNADNYDIMVIFNWIYSMAAIVAVGYIVYGAILFGISEGDPARVKKAKDTVTYSIIGLVIVGLAWAITTFVVKSIN
jgi:hypothetical protein cdiviTM7_00612